MDMVIITILAKILSLGNYCNTKMAGLDENFILQKFLAMQYC